MMDIEKMVFDGMSCLVENANIRKGEIVILGCSTSEINGAAIGKGFVYETGEAVIKGAIKATKPQGIYLAVGCCEHLNRAVIIEKEGADMYGLEIVAAVPVPGAGGSAAAAAYKSFKNPVAVEFIKAHGGMDIGNTLIGMHLKHVAVPLRLSITKIGSASVTYAKTRPKYIGGERAVYHI